MKNVEIFSLIQAACHNKSYATADANFSTQDVNTAAVNAILEEVGLAKGASIRQAMAYKNQIFALISESIDEIMAADVKAVLGEYAEVKTIGPNDEAIFNIGKLGKNRAKLVVSRGSREGIYRTARYSNQTFSLDTYVQTAAVFISFEEILSGSTTLAEMYQDILEAFEESIYKETYAALVSGTSAIAAKYNAHTTIASQSTLANALDDVLPVVKAYGVPTIIGSYQALSQLMNPVITSTAAATGVNIALPSSEDIADIRRQGHVSLYKGARVVELPNYLLTDTNTWFYNPAYVFVIPSGAKPVKIALKGDTYIQDNNNAVGGEKWEVMRTIGVGVAMANNYAVINVSDVDQTVTIDDDYTD